VRTPLFVALLFVVAAGDACDCNRNEAACTQTLLALCEYDALCQGGVAVETCVAQRPDFTCTVDVTSSATCVDAVNAVLERDCADPPADLPCPLLTQSALYEPCGGDLVCSDGRECLGVAGETLCSARCDDTTACPAGGGCSDDDTCGAGCDGVFFRCTLDSTCVDGRCEACASRCSACDTIVDGCDCNAFVAGCAPTCEELCEACDVVVDGCDCIATLGCPVPCVDDSVCGDGFCNGGFCE
jgi:hypothetical protein